MERNENNMLRKPTLATALAIAAGFSFYMLCMMLPLVGPSGSRVPHAAKNTATFVTVLLISFMLAGASTYISLRYRREKGGSLPLFSIGLGVLCILFFVILLSKGFTI